MNGGVQYDYLLNEIDVLEFMRLKRFVERLSAKQEAEMKRNK